MRHITGSHHKFPTGPGLVFVFSVFLSNIWVFPTMTSNILVNVCHKVTSQGLLINSQQARGLAAAANANQSNQIPQFDDFQTKFHSLMIYKTNIGWFFRSWQSWRALPGLKMELGSKLAFFGSLWKRMLEFDNKTFSLADHEDFINSFRNSINSSIGSHPLFLIKRT